MYHLPDYALSKCDLDRLGHTRHTSTTNSEEVVETRKKNPAVRRQCCRVCSAFDDHIAKRYPPLVAVHGMGHRTDTDQHQACICFGDRGCDVVSNRYVRRTHDCDLRARRQSTIGVKEVGRREDLAISVVYGCVAGSRASDRGDIASKMTWISSFFPSFRRVLNIEKDMNLLTIHRHR